MKKFVYIVFILSLQLAVFGGNADKEKSKTKVVAGKITDLHGEALGGTKILVKETGETFFADFDGNFKLELKSDQIYSITIETIGFLPKEIKSSDLSPFSELSLQEL